MARNSFKVQPYESFLSTGEVRNNKHVFVDVSTDSTRSESVIGIPTSLFVSPAYKDLTPRQRQLYLCAIYQYKQAPDTPAKVNDEYRDKRYIYLNFKLVQYMSLYSKSSFRSFYSDVRALIDHGFITPIEKYNHQRTIFYLSDGWKEFQNGCKYQCTNENTHSWEWVRVAF